MADCRPAQVITAGEDQTAPSGLPAGTAWTSLSELSLTDGPAPSPVLGPVAYIIYTSGTTGKSPRACKFPQRLFSPQPKHAPTPWVSPRTTECLCVSPVHFDGSFSAIFPPFVRGVPLVIPDREALLFPRRFFSIVVSEGITATSFSPSYLRLLRAGGRLAAVG